MGFRSLMFAFIFMIDIRIGPVDILPDFIGYFLFFHGLRELQNESEYFEKPLLMSKLLIGYAIIEQLFELVSKGGTNIIMIFLSIASTVALLVMMFGIFMGTEEYAVKRNQDKIADRARNLWYLYIGSVIAVWVSVIIPGLILLLFIPLFIFILIVLGMCMGLMSSASKI